MARQSWNNPLDLLRFQSEVIAERFDEQTEFAGEDFMTLIEDQTFIEQMGQKYAELLSDTLAVENTRYTLEGYLYPATYDIYDDTTLEDRKSVV